MVEPTTLPVIRVERADPRIEQAVAAERERCAKIIEGRVYNQRYREWPEWGTGNRSNDCEITKFADAIAKAIRGGNQ